MKASSRFQKPFAGAMALFAVVGLVFVILGCQGSETDTWDEPASARNVGIYALSPFSDPPDSAAAIAAAGRELGSSGFDTVVLATFHVGPDGSINFNNSSIVANGKLSNDLAPNLSQVLADMKPPNGQVSSILASFGGGGCFTEGQTVGYWDFLHIESLIIKYPKDEDNPFFQNLAVMLKHYPIDGVDLDLEVYTINGCGVSDFRPAKYSSFKSTLVRITNWLWCNGYKTTIAPYEEPGFWTTVLDSTYVDFKQRIAYVNLQSADPDQIQSFLSAFKQGNTGLIDFQGFISAGVQVYDWPPSFVKDFFTLNATAYPRLGGGWIWNFGTLGTGYTAKDYASAVRAGLTAGDKE